LLFFGFIRAYKGLDLLLEALAELKKRVPTEGGGILPFLLIAGEFYEDKNKYLQKIKTLAIENDVKIYSDFIPTNEVNRYFSAADLIVQPYKTATQSGISQIAYHFEKPMIVTNVGGLAEIVPHGEAGYIVEKDPLSIADAIQDFYTNKKQDSFKEGLIRQKSRFSWQKMISVFEQLF
jgi:glycosyltransferase involved in cell wall biosynthesis